MAGQRKWVKWVIIGVVVIILLYAIMAYNRLVTLNQNIDGRWSEVENQYQRQSDLIPNLVSTVASAARVETQYVTAVTEARSRWTTATSQTERDRAGVDMNNGIAALVNAVAVSEDYPELQANKQYVALTDELTGTQNRITVARGNYINAIQRYNVATLRFPSNILAMMFGFESREYYQAELKAMETPVLGNGTLL